MTADLQPLLSALHAVMGEVGYVQKDGTNTQQKYRFASESAFIAALRPALVKHGLELLPVGCDLLESKSWEREPGKWSFRTIVRMRYLLGHVSGATLELCMPGEGIDTSDKATGKACTQSFKWLLRQMFVVETGLEPDRDTPEVTTPAVSAGYRAALQAIAAAPDAAALNAVRARISGSEKLTDQEKAGLLDAAEGRKWEIDNG